MIFDTTQSIDLIDVDGREWASAERYREACKEIERLRAVLRSFTELYHNYSDERVCCGSRYKQPHAADCEVMAVLGEQ